MLDELVDLDEERLNALNTLIRQKERVSKACNKKVKSKAFLLGDLVWKVISPMNLRNRVLGKWSPNWEGPFQVDQYFSNNSYGIRELRPKGRIFKINGKYLKKYKPMLQEIRLAGE